MLFEHPNPLYRSPLSLGVVNAIEYNNLLYVLVGSTAAESTSAAPLVIARYIKRSNCSNLYILTGETIYG